MGRDLRGRGRKQEVQKGKMVETAEGVVRFRRHFFVYVIKDIFNLLLPSYFVILLSPFFSMLFFPLI